MPPGIAPQAPPYNPYLPPGYGGGNPYDSNPTASTVQNSQDYIHRLLTRNQAPNQHSQPWDTFDSRNGQGQPRWSFGAATLIQLGVALLALVGMLQTGKLLFKAVSALKRKPAVETPTPAKP